MENIDTTPFLRVKELAKKKNLTLSQLAIDSGLGENSIYRWKQRNPSAKNLKKVADVLGVSVDYLLGNTDEMHPKGAQKNVNPKDVHIINKIETAGLTDDEKDQLDRFIDFLKAEHVRILTEKNKD